MMFFFRVSLYILDPNQYPIETIINIDITLWSGPVDPLE